MKKKFCFILFLVFPLVLLSQPVGYYNGTEGLKGEALKMKLHEIIRNHHSLSYFFSKYVLYYSDADPEIPGNVILVYTGRSQDGMDYGSGGDKLNREHVWAKSHGQFEDILPMHSDVHNLKPADASVNSSRSNMDFDYSLYYHNEATQCKFTPGESWEPRDDVKGDIARIIFYMDARYKWTNGESNLTVVNRVNTYPLPEHGKLSALLEWNLMDNPDQFERNRNDVIYQFQKNRNPFVDNPHFIELIWGNADLPDFAIGNIAISNDQPAANESVEVSASINPMPVAGNVRLYRGDSFNNLQDYTDMTFSDGKWRGEIPGYPEETIICFSIQLIQETGKNICSPVYNYRVAANWSGEITPIINIQGAGDYSPFENQMVTTTGIVTAFYTNGYFIQAGNGPRTGLFVYQSGFFPAIGDSIVITGMVKEYYGMTEMTNVSMYKLLKNERVVPEPAVLSANEMGEDWESVLVRIPEAVCIYSQHWNNSGMWRVSDGTGQVNVHNNDVFEFDPVLNEHYTVTGPLNYNYSEWKIELRSLRDVSAPTTLPEEGKKVTVFVYPNPTSGEIVVNLSDPATQKSELRFFDVLGQEKLVIFPETGSKSTGLNLNHAGLKDGLYILRYTDKFLSASTKIMLKTQ